MNFIGGKFWCITWMNQILGEVDDARSEDGGSLGRVMREVIVWPPSCFIYKKSKKRTQTIDELVSKPMHVVDVRSAIWYIEFHNSHFFIVFLLPSPLSFIICAHYLICLRVANKQLLEFIYFLSLFSATSIKNWFYATKRRVSIREIFRWIILFKSTFSVT